MKNVKFFKHLKKCRIFFKFQQIFVKRYENVMNNYKILYFSRNSKKLKLKDKTLKFMSMN